VPGATRRRPDELFVPKLKRRWAKGLVNARRELENGAVSRAFSSAALNHFQVFPRTRHSTSKKPEEIRNPMESFPLVYS